MDLKKIFIILFLVLFFNSFIYSSDFSFNDDKLSEYRDLEVDFKTLYSLFPYPDIGQITITPNNLENYVYLPFLDDYIFNDTDLEIYFQTDDDYSGDFSYSLEKVFFSVSYNNTDNQNQISRECISVLNFYENNPILSFNDLIIRTEKKLIESEFSKECIDELIEKEYLFGKNILLKVKYKENNFNKDNNLNFKISSKFLENHFFSKGHSPIKINVSYLDFDFLDRRAIIFPLKDNLEIINDYTYDEFVAFLNYEEENEISEILIKAGVINFLSETDIIEEIELLIKVYHKDERVYFEFDQKSLNILTQISLNSNLFLVLRSNYLFKVSENYFGINENYGVIFQDAFENIDLIFEPDKIIVFEGSLINTLEKIVKEKDLEFSSINFILQKIFEKRSSINEKSSYDLLLETYYDNPYQRYKDLSSYNYVINFIDENFTDLEKEVLTSTFILYNLDSLRNYHLIHKIDDSEFIYDTIIFLKDILFKESNENFILDYYSSYSTETKLDSYFYKSFKNTEYDPDYLKQIYFNLFESLFLFGLLTDKENFNFKNNVSLNNIDFTEKSFKALIHLEDTEVNLERINDRLENSNNLDELVYTLRNPYNFSTKKLNFVEILTSHYLDNDRFTDAFVLTIYINDCFKRYLEENNLEEALVDVIIPGTIDYGFNEQMIEISDSLKKLNKKINQMRLIVGASGFNKMQVDLFTQLETLQNASDLRKTYGERVEDVYNYTQSDVFEPVSILGLDVGKTGLTTLTILTSPTVNFVSILDVVKGNKNLKTRLNILSQKNQVFSEGIYALSTLYARGISWQTLEEWFEDPDSLDLTNKITKQLFANELDLVDYVNLENDIIEVPLPDDLILNNNRVIFNYNENTYSVGYEEYIEVFEFLEELRWKARETYYKSPYSEDIQTFFGKNYLDFDVVNYKNNSVRLGIDRNLQEIAFQNIAKVEGFDVTQTQRVFDFVSYGTSPLSLAILVTTGYYMGNIISPISGYVGSLISVAESIVIDAAIGAILVYGFDLKTEENTKTVIATTLGISAGLGVSKGLLRGAKSSTSKSIVNSLSDADMQRISQVMNLEDIGKFKSVRSLNNHLRKNGLNVNYLDLKKSINHDVRISAFNNEKVKKTTPLITGNREGTIIYSDYSNNNSIFITRVVGDDGSVYHVPYRAQDIMASNDDLLKSSFLRKLNDDEIFNLRVRVDGEVYDGGRINRFLNNDVLENDFVEVIYFRPDPTNPSQRVESRANVLFKDILRENNIGFERNLESTYTSHVSDFFDRAKTVNVSLEKSMYANNPNLIAPVNKDIYINFSNPENLKRINAQTVIFSDDGTIYRVKRAYNNGDFYNYRGFEDVSDIDYRGFSFDVDVISGDGVVSRKLNYDYFLNNPNKFSFIDNHARRGALAFDLDDVTNQRIYVTDKREILRNINILKEGDQINLSSGGYLKVFQIENNKMKLHKFVNNELKEVLNVNRNELMNMVESIQSVERKVFNNPKITKIKPNEVLPRISDPVELERRVQQIRRLMPEADSYSLEDIRRIAHSTVDMDDFLFERAYKDKLKVYIIPENSPLLAREGANDIYSAAGFYFPEDNLIYLSRENLKYPIFVHEFGHYIDFERYIPDASISRFQEGFRLNRMVKSISDYSYDSSTEFFAEATSLWHGFVSESDSFVVSRYIGREHSQKILKEINPDVYDIMKEIYGTGKIYRNQAQIETKATSLGVKITPVTKERLKITIAATGILGLGSHMTVIDRN